jgi:hypothetical protein
MEKEFHLKYGQRAESESACLARPGLVQPISDGLAHRARMSLHQITCSARRHGRGTRHGAAS